MKRISALILALIALPLTAGADSKTGAWIVATPEGRMVTLEAYAVLEGGEGGSYELSATKTGSTGSSTNKQAGKVRDWGGEDPRPLSISRISVEEGATLDVNLKVTSASGEVFESAYVFTGE